MGFSPFDGFSGIMFSIVPVIIIIGFIFDFTARTKNPTLTDP